MRKITSQACKARVRWKNRASKTRVMISEKAKFLPHGTRVLKTRVPKKRTNEDEELEMGRRSRTGEEEAEVPDPKTSLENADQTKKNRGLENTDSTKKNHGLKERRTGEEEEVTQVVLGK